MLDAAEVWSDRLSAARDGSTTAVGAVLDSVRPYLMRVARGELPADLAAKGGASDLVQETFLEAVRHFGRFRGTTDAEFRAWLRCLLRHHASRVRRLYRVARKRQVGREVRLVDVPAAGADVPTSHTSPSGRAVAAEQVELLARAVGRLPADYQTVLRLRYTEGRPFDDVAAVMGRSVNAVTLVWFRAVQRLRAEIGGEL